MEDTHDSQVHPGSSQLSKGRVLILLLHLLQFLAAGTKLGVS